MTSTSRRSLLGMAGLTTAAVAVGGTIALRGSESQAQELTGAATLPGVDTPTHTELTPFKDPLRIPPTLRLNSRSITEINLVNSRQRLHSQLPPTRLWTYGGHFPGPTIEVRSGQKARVAWNNKLAGTLPVKAVWIRPEGPGPGLLPYNRPGSEGGFPRAEVDGLTPWTTVHVHGGHQNGLSDGASEYGVTPGDAQLAEFANDQAAAHLFYHDHAMAITSLNVAAGLVGHYLVRDAEESRLRLPQGEYEIPLMIQEVNFDTDDKGRIDGRILSKRIVHGPEPTPGVMPPALASLCPFTMVNGVVWPHLDVEARAYRFRVVNMSGVRVYRLVVVDEETGKPVRGAMKLIGTDLGLLGKPQTIDEALSLAPAERADLVIDFAAFPGKRLKLVNTIPGQTPGAALPEFTIPYPEVMQFRVEKKRNPKPYAVPATLSPRFRNIKPGDVPKDATERFVLLAFDKSGAMPQIWEMQEVSAQTAPGDGIVQIEIDGTTRALRRTATVFEDTTTFFASSDTWEKWHFVSVAPPGVPIYHPMHIHLMNFQVVERRSLDSTGLDHAAGKTTKPLTPGAALPIAPEESGWKDTVNVQANTIVTVAGRLAKQSGKVMYHCHILDHEDEGMMRPFVIMPAAVHEIHGMVMEMNGKMGAGHGAHAHS
ncbi:multicopper oxidase family protein [Streptomyces cadmiisoli]|nr:multicopper oxidase domain-containing protein [Streptomyces cadmiisoli]